MINRYYPDRLYPDIYPEYVWNTYNILTKDKEFLKKFELFEKNIDYKNEKIMNEHRKKELKKEFIINAGIFGSTFYFGDLKEYDSCMNSEFRMFNRKITTVKQYISEVDTYIEEINDLQYWKDYIVFNGEKYGVPPILYSFHREYDCEGEIICYNEEEYMCDECRKNLTDCVHDIRYMLSLKNHYTAFDDHII